MPTLDEIKKEYESTLEQLNDPELISDWEKFEEINKKKDYLKKIIEKDKEINELKNQIEENKSIITAKEDPDLASLAETEIGQLQERVKNMEKDLGEMMNNKQEEAVKKESSATVIIEIRAGTGGDEAALFAADLFRMYLRYATNQGWSQKVLDSRPTEIGGYKEITFEIKPSSKGNKDIFSKMQYEGGVHRVQRIPETEKSGRIHTSTASVAVLPKPKKASIKMKPDEIRIDTYRASGPGGQYVNKRETAIRITHLPTGLVVTSQTERNQLQNKENALSILEAKLMELKEKEEMEKISGNRKAQIKWAKRSEKIRTYNYPQNRITDHRIKKNWHNLEKILEGELDQVIEALQKSTPEKD